MNDNDDVPPEPPTASSTRRALLQSGGAVLLAAAAGLHSTAASTWPFAPMYRGNMPADSPSDIVLQNDWFTVVFGLRGINRMQFNPKYIDELQRVSPFLEDGFLLQFDDTTLDSRFAAAERQAEGKGGATVVRYRYDFGGGNVVTAVYEFRPDWRFVAKRLVLEIRPSRDLLIRKVAVFAGMTGREVNGHFVQFDSRYEGSNRNVLFVSHRVNGSGSISNRDATFFVSQNPFTVESRPQFGRRVVAYAPDLLWHKRDGHFTSDALCIGPWKEADWTTHFDPVPEWQYVVQPDGYDYSSIFRKFGFHTADEYPAVSACVRAFLKPTASKRNPRLHVGWCENDYQIDVATGEGRAEYGRIFAAAASVGVANVLFTPTNSALSSKAEATDAWGWENLLYLGMGEKIRRGEWDPRHDRVPDALQAILDDAKHAGVRLAAYVYPSLKFRPEWNAGDGGPYGGANSANRDFQDWLVETMVAFQKRTGVSGFSLDYWWLGYKDASLYAQWDGCRRILEALRERLPDTILDGRQSYQGYGPWTWLAGSYPHPTGGDEQPASFRAFPDLHIDRVYGNHQRWAAYRYRVLDYCPTELVPGFMMHQTQRFDAQTTQPMTAFRTRDWDYLGWKYSVLSSIGSAPCNHVVNYLPARDPDEAAAFSSGDKRWLRDWLDWTDTHRETLVHMRPLIGPPAIGFLDANSAFAGDRGFFFVFNPNLRPLDANFRLSALMETMPRQFYLLRYITPAPDALIGLPSDNNLKDISFGFWNWDDWVTLPISGGQALAIEVLPAPKTIGHPLLFDVPASTSITIKGSEVTLTGVHGPFGGVTKPLVMLPPGQAVEALRVNGVSVPFKKSEIKEVKPANEPYPDRIHPACVCVSAEVQFAGTAFDAFHAPISYDSHFTGGARTGTFTIPARIFAQLRARRAAWPIPYTADDLKATWLGSDRLLLFVQIAEPKDTMPVTLHLDDAPLPLEKAYTSIYGQAPEQTFVGWYVDVSHLEPDREYRLAVTVPPLAPGQFQGVYFENVETETTDEILAPKSFHAG